MHAYRSHTCAQLSAANVGETVRLSGWIHRKRDHIVAVEPLAITDQRAVLEKQAAE